MTRLGTKHYTPARGNLQTSECFSTWKVNRRESGNYEEVSRNIGDDLNGSLSPQFIANPSKNLWFFPTQKAFPSYYERAKTCHSPKVQNMEYGFWSDKEKNCLEFAPEGIATFEAPIFAQNFDMERVKATKLFMPHNPLLTDPIVIS